MATVSILLCTYNSENYLRPLLDSILQNTYSDFELFVQDDCSQDETMAILHSYSDPRIHVEQNERPSGSAANNFMSALLQWRTGDYIMFADADDIWHPEKIENTLRAMKDAETIYGSDTPILAHCDLRVVNAKGYEIAPSLWAYEKITPGRNSLKQLLAQNNVTGCAMMINRALKDLVTEKPEHFVMHDWWLALCAAAFGKIVVLDEALIDYRQHQDNSVGAYNASSLSASAKKLMNQEKVHHIYQEMFRQAACFAKYYQQLLTDEQFTLCSAYGNMAHQSHLGRVVTVLRYGFWKNTFVRNLGQLLSI